MGSTDNFLPGMVLMVASVAPCSAAAVPDIEPVKVAKIGTVEAGTEDVPYKSEVKNK